MQSEPLLPSWSRRHSPEMVVGSPRPIRAQRSGDRVHEAISTLRCHAFDACTYLHQAWVNQTSGGHLQHKLTASMTCHDREPCVENVPHRTPPQSQELIDPDPSPSNPVPTWSYLAASLSFAILCAWKWRTYAIKIFPAPRAHLHLRVGTDVEIAGWTGVAR